MAAEAARRQEADANAAQEKERLEAPRRYALTLFNTDGAPVYYFDTKNEMQELGKGTERAPRVNAVPMKRVKRPVERRVYGPNAKAKASTRRRRVGAGHKGRVGVGSGVVGQ